MKDPIDNIRVASPCSASWERMEGDARMRHCTLCELNVYNFAEMSRDEIRELLMRSEGRVCGRLHRRADGTMITRDCPTAVQRVRQRASQWASATMAALLSVASFGCTTAGKSWFFKQSAMSVKTTRDTTRQQAMLSGVVVDPAGAPVPDVPIIVRDKATQREITLTSDAAGKFAADSLTEGRYTVRVAIFQPLAKDVQVKEGTTVQARVVLRQDETVTVLAGAIEIIDNTATAKTTFTSDMLRRLPF